jgi:GTP-binding protein
MPKIVPNYHIQEVNFIGSFTDVKKTPLLESPEFAFIGRSNVGKSSLINYLCKRKKLAKTSSTPGKTQLINLFDVEGKWILADLPGYGYAKISKTTRERWGKMIERYLLEREKLCSVFLLIDSRIPPQEIDIEMINWLGEKQIPFILIFTKTDKMKPMELQNNLVKFFAHLRDKWETLPEYILTSSIKDKGRNEIIDFINDTVEFKKAQ